MWFQQHLPPKNNNYMVHFAQKTHTHTKTLVKFQNSFGQFGLHQMSQSWLVGRLVWLLEDTMSLPISLLFPYVT